MKFKGLLFTLGIGAVAGMIFATKKGNEIAQEVLTKSKEAFDKLTKDLINDLNDLYNDYYDHIEEEVNRMINESDQERYSNSTYKKIDDLKHSVDELTKKAMESEGVILEEIIEKINKISATASAKIKEYRETMIQTGEVDDLEEKINEIINDEQEEINEIMDEIDKQ